MKIPSKLRHELEAILADMDRAETYLLSPDIIGIATRTDRPNGGDYTIRNPACVAHQSTPAEHITAMHKQAGSDIAGLYAAARRLRIILSATGQED